MRTLHIALAAAALALSACTSQPAEDLPPRPVLLATPVPADTLSAPLIGQARATQRAELAFPVAGRVTGISVEVGQRVRRGEVLATLDTAPVDAQLRAARAEVARTSAVAVEARRREARLAPLARSGAAAAGEWEAMQAEAVAAASARDAAAAQLDEARWQAEHAVLRAPFDGVVAMRELDVGQSAGPDVPVLAIDGTGREAVVSVPMRIAARLRVEQPVRISRADGTDLAGSVRAIGERGAAGGVVQTVIALTKTGTQEDASGDPVRPGEVLRVRFAGDGGGTLLLPVRAVKAGKLRGHGTVLRYRPGVGGEAGTVEAVPVRLGGIVDDRIEILAGLQPHDRVVAAGVSFLVPGASVAPVASSH